MDIAKYLIEGLFAVVLCGIGFFLKLIADKLEKLSDAINEVEMKLVEHFVTKHDWEQLRVRLHDLSALIGKVDQWQRFRDEDDRRKESRG